ncbi:putative ubiquinone biosynthesis methyltransferase Coq5 [Terfezia boudieri ATCC MYA-4762]|uniref:2-methoxy-6-polyprenyl-1,4-benzoquinol methylase, mitochondrial n=1 Tax=Terfezia boudieri ATCC MYA-4762 TaxID=1051890 RepID=A0A3N4L860_9PEZI|nr:putative ubiquinone biosynthesis methyltransferase Coq5 [Terfezia boudieri ATCC MYA-4762]
MVALQQQQEGVPSGTEKTTHFGFQTISESKKADKVAEVFSSVASSYDRMNDVLSAGIHRLWKDHFVRSLNPGRRPGGSPMSILDVAGGTGDIAFRMLDHATRINHDTETRITCADINADMLREGERRSLVDTPYGGTDRISFLVQDAETLDAIPDNSVDLYTISFGIRNVTNIPAALRSAHRVLKPGGVFACLEFSKVRPAMLDAIYQRYSFSVIPMLGQLVAGDRDSYQYLVESIKMFPSQEQFAKMVEDAGFMLPGKGFEELTFGVASVWKGVKPLH